MKLVKPSYEILEPGYTFDNIKKHIELCGRTCYKSEDKITETSSSAFIQRIMRSGHTSVLEHGTIYLIIPPEDKNYMNIIYSYQNNKYSEIRTSKDIYDDNLYITTNYRVIFQNDWEKDLLYISKPNKVHAKRVSVRFICNRQVSHEFVRHRVFSFSQESTRYCNYSKDKFGNKITYIIPCWLNIPEGDITTKPEIKGEEYLIRTFIDTDGLPTSVYGYKPNIQEAGYYSNDEYITGDWSDDRWLFIRALEKSEDDYMTFINKGWKPQQAANILPNALKTELVMTGFIKYWEQFFGLRCAPDAHPQARELASALKDEFINRNYINL